MTDTTMLLTEWAQGLITAGCVSLALAVMYCVVRDGIREVRIRKQTSEHLEAAISGRSRR